MKKTNKNSIEALHSSIKNQLEGNSDLDAFGTETVTFNGNFGHGSCGFSSFEDGISVMHFNGHTFNDVTFNLDNQDCDLYHFFYVTDGHCFQNFKGVDSYQKIEVFSPTVVGCSTNLESQLVLKKDVEVNLTIITMDSSLYFENYQERYNVNDEDFTKLTDIFSALRHYMYECSPNLNIVEKLDDIANQSTQPTVTYKHVLESQYKLILAEYMAQIYTEFYEERVVVELTRTELQKVKEITDYIVENPGIDLSLDKLCSKVIMSQSKLQKGFKCVHNTTVSNYIRDVRLEKAKDLLLKSDLNVSEIVYSVGFTSRSYFCKIFKNKYNLNPTSYRTKYKDQSIQAELLNMS